MHVAPLYLVMSFIAYVQADLIIADNKSFLKEQGHEREGIGSTLFVKSIAAYFITFGVIAALALLRHFAQFQAALIGMCSGALAGAATLMVLSYLKQRRANATPSLETFVGSSGVVIEALEDGNVGKVMVSCGNREFTYPAHATEGSIPMGRRVSIVGSAETRLIVAEL